MKITIKDVAKKAGVVPSTVSRVMSGKGKISDSTKQRVKNAIKELDYKPNSIAQKLVSRKSKILGVILPENATTYLNNPFFIEAMRGLGTIAEENSYCIVYSFAKNEDEELKNIKNFTLNNLIDGICLLTIRENDRSVAYLKKAKLPFVVIGSPDLPTDILWVDNDNVEATFNVTNLLIKRNYKKIAFIGANKKLKVSRNRLKGFKKAIIENKIFNCDNLICEEKDFSEESGFNAMKKILETQTPDIVITTEDLLATGANRCLKEQNINIKVIGFNNTPLMQYQNPPISSIDIDAFGLGYNAGKLLINTLNNIQLDSNYKIIKTKFIER